MDEQGPYHWRDCPTCGHDARCPKGLLLVDWDGKGPIQITIQTPKTGLDKHPPLVHNTSHEEQGDETAQGHEPHGVQPEVSDREKRGRILRGYALGARSGLPVLLKRKRGDSERREAHALPLPRLPQALQRKDRNGHAE